MTELSFHDPDTHSTHKEVLISAGCVSDTVTENLPYCTVGNGNQCGGATRVGTSISISEQPLVERPSFSPCPSLFPPSCSRSPLFLLEVNTASCGVLVEILTIACRRFAIHRYRVSFVHCYSPCAFLDIEQVKTPIILLKVRIPALILNFSILRHLLDIY